MYLYWLQEKFTSKIERRINKRLTIFPFLNHSSAGFGPSEYFPDHHNFYPEGIQDKILNKEINRTLISALSKLFNFCKDCRRNLQVKVRDWWSHLQRTKIHLQQRRQRLCKNPEHNKQLHSLYMELDFSSSSNNCCVELASKFVRRRRRLCNRISSLPYSDKEKTTWAVRAVEMMTWWLYGSGKGIAGDENGGESANESGETPLEPSLSVRQILRKEGAKQ